MIDVYSKPNCVWCDRAKNLLKSHEIPFRELVIGKDVSSSWVYESFPNVKSVPIILQDNVFLGGYDQLEKKIIQEGENFGKQLILE